MITIIENQPEKEIENQEQEEDFSKYGEVYKKSLLFDHKRKMLGLNYEKPDYSNDEFKLNLEDYDFSSLSIEAKTKIVEIIKEDHKKRVEKIEKRIFAKRPTPTGMTYNEATAKTQLTKEMVENAKVMPDDVLMELLKRRGIK